ncbi:MAG TPA: DUF1553 domain-containing protein [Verrucomicrobiae bacterium]|nr:DUF1553 domain-containing protein [Verrucomicrobiae bacterium]
MTDAPEVPATTKILSLGDYKHEGAAVPPGFISALDPNPAVISKSSNPKTLGRRLTLAHWITSPTNPLTARVFVNRAWQAHFGQGLVRTPNDLGLAGARPTHPELLDWLASEFIREGWSVKKLHRLIVTSSTYRRSSSDAAAEKETLIRIGRRQPSNPRDNSENLLLTRQNLRRLTGEQLRDALLTVSGKLLDHPGGPPIWPELPSEILVANPAFLDDNAEKTKGWYPSASAEQNVRSIFLVQKRTVKIPFLETFDLPENAASCARRTESVVAPQALALLNGSLTIEAAKAFAARLKTESSPSAKVNKAFAFALQRPPAPDELRASISLLNQRGTVELCRALLNLNEFVYID